MSLGNLIHICIAALKSPRGRNALMFLLFVIVSAILWCILSLNEEDQRDLRLPVRITHVPDSVTLISTGPQTLNASLKGRGTQLLKMSLGSVPTVNVDFRAYHSQGMLKLSNVDLKALVRNSTGGVNAIAVYPDSFSIPYTAHRGYSLPVKIDYKATAAPQSAITGRPRVTPDSVRVYMSPGYELPEHYRDIDTEPLRMMALDKTTTVKAKLIGPPHARLIPDSVDVTFEVEAMIFKSRKIVIEPVNVPANVKLITFPAQVDVFFMTPMSEYNKGNVRFRVVADYNAINPNSPMVSLRLQDVPPQLHNIQLSTDSAEYIIERH